jgi:hypothetical protein
MMFRVFGIITNDFCFVFGFIDLFMLSLLVVGGVFYLNVVICLQSFISWSYLQCRHDTLELGKVLKTDYRELNAIDVYRMWFFLCKIAVCVWFFYNHGL